MSKFAKTMLAALLCVSAIPFSGCGSEKYEPVTITVWTYYNGAQLESFNEQVELFNETVGAERGITVEAYSHGSVSDLELNVMNSATGKVGAELLPNIFSAYADNAYEIDQMGLIADLRDYFTEEERSKYISDYLKEGDFDGDGSIKIFPIVKSTELMFLNDTDWKAFSEASGIGYDTLSTIEGVVATAEKYYEWTDSLTDTTDDGKALFGRDAMANYMLVGAKELGCTIFNVNDKKMTVDFDKTTARKLWDNYYIPFVKGYFGAAGRFRSDDVKTGNILGYVGSNSSATFFPKHVITGDTEEHDITMKVLPCPKFADGDNIAVQQGAGMVVTKASEREIEASVEFLKWFTSPDNSVKFSVESGYLPVTYEANSIDFLKKSGLELSGDMEAVISKAFEAVKSNELYTPKGFEGGRDARKVLEYSMSDLAITDRATVVRSMENGSTREEALKEFISDSYFEKWYSEILVALREYEE